MRATAPATVCVLISPAQQAPEPLPQASPSYLLHCLAAREMCQCSRGTQVPAADPLLPPRMPDHSRRQCTKVGEYHQHCAGIIRAAAHGADGRFHGLSLRWVRGSVSSRGLTFELTPTVEADADWPRKDNFYHGLERPGGGCRSGSGVERVVRRHRADAGGSASRPGLGRWTSPQAARPKGSLTCTRCA